MKGREKEGTNNKGTPRSQLDLLPSDALFLDFGPPSADSPHEKLLINLLSPTSFPFDNFLPN